MSVKVVQFRLCGSDIPRIFAKGAHYYPITLGHRIQRLCGILRRGGNRPAARRCPSPACRCCPASSARNASASISLYVKQYQFVGSRSEGGNAEYVVVKRANLFRLPDQMPIDDGAFIEPITVGLHAFHLAQGCEGKT